MVTNEQITVYRNRVSFLLMELRSLLFIKSGRVSYPTDTSIAYRLGISSTALSSISRQCSSMSGITLFRLLREIALLSSPGDFTTTMVQFFNVP